MPSMATASATGLHGDMAKRYSGHDGTDDVELVDKKAGSDRLVRQHDWRFVNSAGNRRQQSSPLPGGRAFPPLSLKARQDLGPMDPVMAESRATGSLSDRDGGGSTQSTFYFTGTSVAPTNAPTYGTLGSGRWNPVAPSTAMASPKPGLTTLATRPSESLSSFRIALPLDTMPRSSPRSTRILRNSAYGKSGGSWDRTDPTHLQASRAQVMCGPSPNHAENLRPWTSRNWKKWQANPTERKQSPRSQKRLWQAELDVRRQEQQWERETNLAPDPEAAADEVADASAATGAAAARAGKFVGSALVREWWNAHQSCVEPYRHSFKPCAPPKRVEKEVWGPAGRGVLRGWYTPRVTTSERMAEAQARQEEMLLHSAQHAHKTGAEAAAEDREIALRKVEVADVLWASCMPNTPVCALLPAGGAGC